MAAADSGFRDAVVMKLPHVDKLTWTVGLGTTFGMAGQSGSSFIFYALNHAGLSVEAATTALTVEGIVMGVVMLVAAPAIHRLALRPALAFAVMLALLAQVASAYAQGFDLIIAARLASGIGFGLIYAIASASAAAAATPERVFAAAGTIQLVAGTALNPVLGRGQAMGMKGVFLAIAIYGAMLAVGLLFAPPPRSLKVAIPQAVASRPSVGAIATVLLMMILFAVGTNGVYIYYVPVAAKVGLSEARLGDGLALVSLVGALGGVAASWLGMKAGRLLPLTASLLAMGAASIWLLRIDAAWQFWLVFTLWIAVYIFANAYLFGVAVAVDPGGRLAAALGGILLLANAAGTWAVGQVSARLGPEAWGWVTLACCALAAVAGAASNRFAVRKATA